MSNPFGRWLRIPTRADRLRAQNVREDLVQAVERTPFGRQSDRRLGHIAARLRDDEIVIQLLEGRYAKAVGVLVLTSQRIVFEPRDPGRPEFAIVVPEVISATGRMHRGLGVVDMTTSSGTITVDQILGTQATTFSDSVLRAKNQAARTGPPPDPIKELAELRALHEAGMIDDAEFVIRKRGLFDQI